MRSDSEVTSSITRASDVGNLPRLELCTRSSALFPPPLALPPPATAAILAAAAQKSTGCLQNSHGARFVDGFVPYTLSCTRQASIALGPLAFDARPEGR